MFGLHGDSAVELECEAPVDVRAYLAALGPGHETAPARLDAGVYIREQLSAALNTAANLIGDMLNPEGIETSDTIYDTSVLDLPVNVTAQLLDHPDWQHDGDGGLGRAIAAAYTDVRPDFGTIEVPRWNRHANDIGDHCPWLGELIPAGYNDGTGEPRCPAGCRASSPAGRDSQLADPEPGSPAWNAAVVATVRGWFE